MGKGQRRAEEGLGRRAKTLDVKDVGLAEPPGFAEAGGPLQGQLTKAVGNIEQGRGGPSRDHAPGVGDQLAPRTALAMQHLVGYGLSKDPARVAVIVQDTALVPLELLEQALRLTRQTHTGDFPPSVGQVIATAKALDQKHRPEYFDVNAGGGLRAPAWYRAMDRTTYSSRQIAAAQ